MMHKSRLIALFVVFPLRRVFRSPSILLRLKDLRLREQRQTIPIIAGCELLTIFRAVTRRHTKPSRWAAPSTKRARKRLWPTRRTTTSRNDTLAGK
jgi:hypothetical protein